MAGYVPSMYKALAKTPAAHEKKKENNEKEKEKREKGRKSKKKLRIQTACA